MARKERVPEPQWRSVWLTTFPRGLQLLLCLAMPSTAVSGALPHCPAPAAPKSASTCGQAVNADVFSLQRPNTVATRCMWLLKLKFIQIYKNSIWLLGLALGPTSSAQRPRELVAAGSDSSDTGRARHCRRLY